MQQYNRSIEGACRVAVSPFQKPFQKRSCHSFFFSLFISSWLTSSRCNSDQTCGIEWLLVTAKNPRPFISRRFIGPKATESRTTLFLFHSSSLSFPTKSRSRGSFLVNIAVSSKRLQYGKSTSLLSPIGSSTGLYTARI